MVSLPPNNGWILYADCNTTYSGRATSFLERGNYLIIFKADKSLAIHGASLIQPRNYLGSNTTISQTDNTIEFTCKRETITVKIYNMISFVILEQWSDNKIAICRTEQELALKIFHNWHDYIDDQSVEILYHEYPTPLGPIDVLGRSLTTDFVVEVKRRAATVNDGTQLRKYIEAIEDPTRAVRGFLAAPRINQNAIEYLTKHGLEYFKVDF